MSPFFSKLGFRETCSGDRAQNDDSDDSPLHAQAHADFPQPTGCPALAGTVSGDATIVNEQTNPSQLPVVVGFVSIPPQGGHDHQLRDPDRSAQPDSTPAAL